MYFDRPIEPAVLTREVLERAINTVAETQYVPCPHIIHPKARGYTTCGNCFALLYVVEDAEGRLIQGVPPKEG